MGCPQAIVAHLAGLQDVHTISFNFDTRIFQMHCEDTITLERMTEELHIVSREEAREFTLDTFTAE